MTQNEQTIVDANLIDDEIPAWKRLENAISLWVRTRQHEEQMKSYAKMKEYYA
jgi:hypothetical protein